MSEHKPMRVIYLFFILFFHVPFILAQSMELESYKQRIIAIESQLGVNHLPLDSMDDVLKRLDELTALSESARVVTESPPLNTELDSDETQNSLHSSINSLELGGWVMLSYFYDDKRDLSTFTANVVELDLRYAMSNELSFTAELDFVNEDFDLVNPAYRNLSYGRGLVGSGSLYGNSSMGNDEDDDFIWEQMYVHYHLEDWSVKAGKFNTPYGLDQIDPWDWIGILPSIVFSLYPHNATGIKSDINLGDRFTISPYISNGLGNDLNTNDSFVYSIYNQYRPTDEILLAANISYGAFFPDNNSDDGWLLNMDATYTGVTNTLIGLQALWFTSESNQVAGFTNADDIQYYGLLGIVTYDWNHYFRTAIQTGFVEDTDGFIWGRPQERWEFSFIPSFYPAEWIEVRLQYQHTEANGDFIPVRHTNPVQDRVSSSDDLFAAALYVKF